jgi:hypothetical protein
MSISSSPDPIAGQQQSKPSFLITIDTEGDNLWGNSPGDPTTRNSKFLWRFQDLCEEFGLKPTYLTDYEMARCNEFKKLGLDVIRRNTGEIGMHLHAWHSPPHVPLTSDDNRYKPFLIEYPDQVIRDKVQYMTTLLENTFCIKPVSHRAGRWAFDERYARALVECGYKVDCSVTPGVSWARKEQVPAGAMGTDYTSFRGEPYWMNLNNIAEDGEPCLLQVPVTILRRTDRSSVRPRIARKALNYLSPELSWLRPNGRNLKYMLEAIEEVIKEERSHAEFMLHSSELMPGGSPHFKSDADIERLYKHLRILFSSVSGRFEGVTLAEFHDQWGMN